MSLLFRAILILFLFATCSPASHEEVRSTSLIPLPADLTVQQGFFEVNNQTTIVCLSDDSAAHQVVSRFRQLLEKVTSFSIPWQPEAADNAIVFSLDTKTGVPDEGYHLVINGRQVKITASSAAGLYCATQTLRQLWPEEFDSENPPRQNFRWQALEIHDTPRYRWRGAMLDVARHFFTIEEVKRYIDYLAFYKMNVLHLHLSDDQGWRIEMKKWPRLTAFGAQQEVGGTTGGFYTQEQYRELVQYAADRFVLVVPEIDLPGHTHAAMASYPELSCDGRSRELYTGIDVGFSSLCYQKESTFAFIADVVDELAALTPGPFLHIGGDEALSTPHEEYVGFITRIQQIVRARGKRMIGWEEIAQAHLDSTSVAQYWSNQQHAKDAAAQGAMIILSPATRVYLDMKYDSTSVFGQDWAGLTSVEKSYQWLPDTVVSETWQHLVLGIEAPLWSETITHLDEAEYLAFPRLPGIAELAWTNSNKRTWSDYRQRLGRHAKRFDAWGIHYFRSPEIEWQN